MDSNKLPVRTRPAHLPPVRSGNRSIIIFVTVCTKNRRPCLADADVHRLICNAWKEADHFHVGRYVIMPDHLHLFCSPATPDPESLKNWCSFWKARVASNWPYPFEGKLWLKGYWDRQLRSGDSYADKWDYVRNNPVRADLVASPDQWPYQGELELLKWHDA
jgi:putative transposase